MEGEQIENIRVKMLKRTLEGGREVCPLMTI